MNIIQNIPIGYKFKRRDKKRHDVETVLDIFETFSRNTGDLIETRYLVAHEFMGQMVTDRVPITTIQMGSKQ